MNLEDSIQAIDYQIQTLGAATEQPAATMSLTEAQAAAITDSPAPQKAVATKTAPKGLYIAGALIAVYIIYRAVK